MHLDDNLFFLIVNYFLTFQKRRRIFFSLKNEPKKSGHWIRKKTSESLENCITSDTGILNAHFSILIKKNRKCKKINCMNHPTTHVTCHMSHVTCHMTHRMCLMSHVTWDMSQVTCHMSHVNCDMSHMIFCLNINIKHLYYKTF